MITLKSFPDSWKLSHIGLVCHIIMGQSPPGASYNKDEQGLPLIAGAGDLGEEFPKPTKWTTTPSQVCQDGDLIYCIRATIGKMNWADREYCLGRGVSAIRSTGKFLDLSYLFYWLLLNNDYINSLGTGSTFIQIRREDMEKIPLPLPPISEQRRIAAILRKADEIRKLRRQANERAEQLIPALFYDMFGDPVTNPKRWNLQTLRSISKHFSDGPFGSNLKTKHYTKTGIRVIRLQNIGIGQFLDEDKTFISPDYFVKLSNHTCLPGDVIVGTLGDPNLRACILPHHIPIALNKADCIQIKVDDTKATAEYICWLLNLPETLYLANRLIQGQTRTRINMSNLSDLKIPIAPLNLQMEFTEIVHQYDQIIHYENQVYVKTDTLFQSLLSRAFTGELTARWREEHAEELEIEALERDLRLKERGIVRVRAPEPTVKADTMGMDARETLIEAMSTEQRHMIQAITNTQEYLTTPPPLVNGHTPLSPHMQRRGLELLAASGVVAQVSLTIMPTGGVTFYPTAYRPLRPTDDSRDDDLEALGKVAQ